MSDFDADDDFKRFQPEEDIKPIEIGAGGVPVKSGASLMPGGEYRAAAPPDAVDQIMAGEFNILKRGDYLDLLKKDTTLRRLRIGAGWEQRALEEKNLDIDLSVFMLDRNDKTRDDGDFIFYNNPTGFEGGCKHLGDNRSGAGEGDDETLTLDLNSIPFDVMKIMFVLSIYDDDDQGHNFSLVRDVFLRLVNEDDQNEICRVIFDERELTGGNACYMAAMIREGPKWIFEFAGKFVNGGLGEIASGYDIIVRELQSTGN